MNIIAKDTLQKEPTLSIRLIGEPQIFLGENQPVQFQYRKSVALLAYLAATQKAYSREYLADFFWRNLSEKNAQAGLRKTLSDINREIPNLLAIESHSISLSISSSIEIDCLTFEKTILTIRKKSIEELSETHIKQLENLLLVYRQPFLNGFTVQNAPDFDNWILLQRGYLHNLIVEALLKLCDYTYWAGQYQRSMEYAQELLQIEPALEEAHYKLMSLYALNGQRTMALNQYAICKEALYETYRSLPKKKIDDLYDRIRSEQGNKPLGRTLPVPTSPIYGREEDIEHVLFRLAEEQCRILTITGPGGIGKTHLALMVGNEINRYATEYFEDGVIFVSLQALNSIHSLSSSIAHQLGYSYVKESDPVEQLCDFLAPYKMVLILDNFEQLVVSLQSFQGEQYDLLSRILQSAPGVKLLITSRIRLNFQGEYVYPLHGISYPVREEKEIASIRNYPAVLLFLQRAEQLNGRYDPGEEELHSIIDICQSVNGLPLGILLAAGWTNLLTAREIADNIKNGKGQKRLEIFATGGQDMPERHRDMDSVFRQSWRMISAKQQKMLAALSFFPSSFSIEAAIDVSQADLSDLRVLLDHSLLDRKFSGRLKMHDLLRQYASSQGVDISGVYLRICHYYSARVVQWEKDLKNERQIQAIDEMNLEIDNLRAIWDENLSNENYLCAAKMFEGMCHYYRWRHYYAEAANFCENLIRKLEEKQTFEPDFSIQDTYRLLAKVLTWQSTFIKLDKAGAYLSRSMKVLDDPILEGCDIRAERAFTSYWMAAISSQTGKFNEAIQLYNESKFLYESLQDEWHLKNLYLSQGIMLWDKSDYYAGKKLVEESLAISRSIGDRRGIANALLWLGNILLFLGDRKGEKMVRESLSLFSELGDGMSGRSATVQACSSLFILGMYEEACDLLQKNSSLNTYNLRQDSFNTIFAISLIHTGNYEEARLYVEKGVTFARELGEAHAENLALNMQSWFFIYEKDFEKAEKVLHESLLNSHKHNVKEMESLALSLLALIWVLMKKNGKILSHIQKAIQIAEEINSYTSKLFALASFSLFLSVFGDRKLGYAVYAYAWQYPLLCNSVWWKDHVGLKIEELAEELPGDEIELAKIRFTEMTLDDVISSVMNEMKAEM